MKKIVFIICILNAGIFFSGCSSVEPYGIGQQSIRGPIADSGMVVTAHPLASQIGVEILKQGGNAIDAAIAVHFALSVVYPNAGNIGGGGFMVLRMNSGEINALDFREKAPLKATRNMYLDESGNVMKGMSETGLLSAGVPGSVDGMYRAYKKYGSLPWKELLQPAIDLAENGFPITQMQADEFNKFRKYFLLYNDSSDAVPLVKNATWKKGDTLRQKELAATLKRIRNNGREGFYSGKTADDIIRLMKRSGGIISYDDLKGYHSVWRTPVTGYYNSSSHSATNGAALKIISMPPPSSGGIALIQLLNMVEHHLSQKKDWNKEEYIHLLVEAEKKVYADRSVHLGDPDFYAVPVCELLDSLYIISRFSDFEAGKIISVSEITAGKFSSGEKEETTHFSIVDKWRNAVAVTTTLNGSYGSFIFVPGSGFLLNNEMDDFSIKPGTPNAYGLMGAEANAIAPGKRMLSSMTPCILEKNGKLFMVIGTPGGSTIITSVLQTILNVAEYGMTMQEAVDAKKFHHQWRPDTIFAEEKALDSMTISALSKMGYHILTRPSIGRTDCILVLPDGKLEGGADSRGDDKAAGY